MTRPMSRESLIYKNVHGPSHVMGENNSKPFWPVPRHGRENNEKLFFSRRMRLGKRNCKVVFFTCCSLSHNRDICKVVCDPSDVTGAPNLQKHLWPVPCHGREHFKILCGPSHVTVERTIIFLCPVVCCMRNEITKYFSSGPISHNRQVYKVVCHPSHVTEKPNLQTRQI